MGRVVFLNCDPLFDSLDESWRILPAPPSWLTGHLLKGDCLVAAIPSADYAKHIDDLILLPDVGISSNGKVGSVLLFGKKDIVEMKRIALPTDSATSRKLLVYLLRKMGFNPETVEMGPDLSQMLENCDGALLIGDRALWESENNPSLVKMDLGEAWLEHTGLPMVFGVFAGRKDSPIECLLDAHKDLVASLCKFNSGEVKNSVIKNSSNRSEFSIERVEKYFSEVSNNLGEVEVQGLEKFLKEVCEISESPNFLKT